MGGWSGMIFDPSLAVEVNTSVWVVKRNSNRLFVLERKKKRKKERKNTYKRFVII